MLDDELVLSISNIIDLGSGRSKLNFRVFDPTGQMRVMLQAVDQQIAVKKDLISFIQSKPGLSYEIN